MKPNMQDRIMACFGRSCEEKFTCYQSPEEAKRAKQRDREISKALKQQQKEDLKQIKILLLGTGESGKSTMIKQMRIIHINGFNKSEREEKIGDINKNIKESMLVLLSAMQKLRIQLRCPENDKSRDYILQEAAHPEIRNKNEFLDHAERLWLDEGVQECYRRSHEFQLIDSAKYFLDKLQQVKDPEYVPSEQDILRCRCVTSSIQDIKFEVPDGGQKVNFNVYDVGGQQGERKKWIQVFDGVAAILFIADCSSFDQTLREDPTKNRLLDALENFDQVWNNRFLKNVSVLLFLNKIDILAEKIMKERSIKELTEKYPDIFPDFDNFSPSTAEKKQFLDSYPCSDPQSKKRPRGGSRSDVHPDIVRTAVYIQHIFMKIVKGEIKLRKGSSEQDKDHHDNHSCETFYTCAIDTNNVQRVLNGCRTLIIQNHLRRFGII